MANPSHCCRRKASGTSTASGVQSALPAQPVQKAPPAAQKLPAPEPEVRRWPHSTNQEHPRDDSEIHWIRASLSYQNQTLADIKALLEQLVLEQREQQDHN